MGGDDGNAGFVRLALEGGAAVVPVLVLGEIDSLRNLWDLPDFQQWTYKKIGFPIPYIVVGRWGVSPLPSQRPVKFIIGTPVDLPPADKILDADGQVPLVSHAHICRRAPLFGSELW